MELSILICTLPDRKDKFDALKFSLDLQVQASGGVVEILSDDGDGSVGAKRNRLLDRSTGRYIAYIDDDDRVPLDYCPMILKATAKGVDCVGIQGVLMENGREGWKFRHSITVGRWCKDKSNHIYFRTPNHLNPIKREYALATRFPDISYGEDRSYSDRIRPLLKTEEFIEATLYYYNIYQK